MNFLRNAFFLLTFPALAAGCFGAVTGICDDPRIAFSVEQPPGWVVDPNAGRPVSLCLVAYPQGKSWKKTPSAIYANIVERNTPASQSMKSLMQSDVETYQLSSPGIEIRAAPDIRTADHHKAAVRHFSKDPVRNSEAVAYIEEKQVIVILVLSCKSVEDYEKSLPAFEHMVKSYRRIRSQRPGFPL